jgi:putative ABC transport system ATP-binding protein
MQPVVQLENVTKTYSNGEVEVHAVRGITLQVMPGEFVAIMGSSGSGKSTLMNVLGCLDRPTGGDYLLDGRTVSAMRAGELAAVRNEKIGFVFQSFELLPRLTALENVELPLLYSRGKGWGWARQRRKLAEEALQRVGLGKRMDHRPNQLSGGQKQRVAIARALIAKPRILMADEPTGNLDTTTTEEILALFAQIHAQGQTVLMVTHENDVAAHCERVVRLRDGLVLSDLPAEQDAAVGPLALARRSAA